MGWKNSGFVGKHHLGKQGRDGVTNNVVLREVVCGNFNWSKTPQDRTWRFSVGIVKGILSPIMSGVIHKLRTFQIPFRSSFIIFL
jgi:hypothetical protein